MLNLYTLLTSIDPISAIVGTRVYPLLLPTSVVLPAIEYTTVSCTQTQTFDNAGTQRWRVELNCWGVSYSAASGLRDVLIASLNGYRNGNTVIQFLTVQDFPFVSTLLQYRCMVEFYIYTSGFGSSLIPSET